MSDPSQTQIELRDAVIHKLLTRIEVLEAALREIMDYSEPGLLIQTQAMRRIARAALETEK